MNTKTYELDIECNSKATRIGLYFAPNHLSGGWFEPNVHEIVSDGLS